MRAKRPFPLEKPRFHKSLGVHSPDPLRDDPSHPHASLGPDDHIVGFKEGGVIPGNTAVVTSSEATGGFKAGGVIGNKRGAKVKKGRKKLGADDLGSGLASDAAKNISGRESEIERKLREAGA